MWGSGKNVGLGSSRLTFQSPLGDLGLVVHSQPNLRHRIVVRIKLRRGEWYKLLWIPSVEKSAI